jgi:hypothetical protein
LIERPTPGEQLRGLALAPFLGSLEPGLRVDHLAATQINLDLQPGSFSRA